MIVVNQHDHAIESQRRGNITKKPTQKVIDAAINNVQPSKRRNNKKKGTAVKDRKPNNKRKKCEVESDRRIRR